MDLSLPERLSHCTVRVECRLATGETSEGTGFFYAFRKGDSSFVPAIVTNNHVVNGAVHVRLRFTRADSEDRPMYGHHVLVELTLDGGAWKSHPDPDVDLAILPFPGLVNRQNQVGEPIFYRCLTPDQLPSSDDVADMVGLENIVMVGYPNGLWDEANNLPIFRRGVLASGYRFDWNGKQEFLIDAACFPGSSGSPVMLCDLAGYPDRTNTVMIQPRLKLLGILCEGPEHKVDGKIEVSGVKTNLDIVPTSMIPMNLGLVIKSSRLRDFESLV